MASVGLAALGGADECVRPYIACGNAVIATVHSHTHNPWKTHDGRGIRGRGRATHSCVTVITVSAKGRLYP